MDRLNPDYLSVEFRAGVTPTEPVTPRLYTLTHSDITGELFLTIGLKYAYNTINPSIRDEVFGKWVHKGSGYCFNVYLTIDSPTKKSIHATAKRDEVFRRELPLALEAIRYGDSVLFEVHPELDNAPIMVYFQSMYADYDKVENWGTFKQYT